MRVSGWFLSAEERLKVAIIGWIALVDAWWIFAAGFHFDLMSLAVLVVAMAALLIVSEFYRRTNRDPQLMVITRETAWLLAFTAAAALLSNLAITANFPLIDRQLAAVDRALGFDWVWWYVFASSHRAVGWLLSAAYVVALPEIAIVMVLLARQGRVARASELVLAAMIGALIAIAISTVLPSAGALAYFHPNETGLAARPIVDLTYKSTFYDLRAGTVRDFSLTYLKGLIAFPSYHATLCVVTLLATRGMPRLFWPLAAITVVILASAPMDGGHHLADVLAGVVVALVAVAIAAAVTRRFDSMRAAAASPPMPGVVSEKA